MAIVSPGTGGVAADRSAPGFLQPALATLAAGVPASGEWLYELKFDGYRLLLRRGRGKVNCLTRNGHDWTGKFGTIVAAAEKLGGRDFIVDGEAVVLDAGGRSNFQKLQQGIKDQCFGGRLFFYAFDLLWLDGKDLRDLPIEERKARLRDILPAKGVLRYSEHVDVPGDTFFRHACQIGLEGIMCKRAGSRYASGRSKTWLKVKCIQRQEFIIGGWTDPEGSRKGFGALLAGVREGETLRYMGKVGTGFDAAALAGIHKRLRGMSRKDPPFASVPRDVARVAHWVEPRLVAEIAYTEVTGDGQLRHPSFQGLREDKLPGQIVLETPIEEEQVTETARKKEPARKAAAKRTHAARKDPSSSVAGVSITHPERRLFSGIGLTKADFARCMERLAPHMLPFVGRRPLSLIRCPQGPEHGCFFQKHFETARPSQLHPVEIAEKEGAATVTYVYAKDVAGIVALVQMGIVEIHPWGSRVDAPYKPDQVIFDLDPAEEMEWEQVLGATFLLRDILEDMGLETFVKTSGGKGLHIYVPIQRGPTWDEVKEWSRRVALRMVERNPTRLVATASKAARTGKIFVDYLRNGRGATCVGAYCPRARPGAPVSTPVTWDEVGAGVKADQFSLENIFGRLDKLAEDPWARFRKLRQRLPKLKM